MICEQPPKAAEFHVTAARAERLGRQVDQDQPCYCSEGHPDVDGSLFDTIRTPGSTNRVMWSVFGFSLAGIGAGMGYGAWRVLTHEAKWHRAAFPCSWSLTGTGVPKPELCQ